MASFSSSMLLSLSGQSLKRLRRIRQVIYVITVTVLITVLALMVYQCLNFYLDEPTYFSTQIVPQNQAEFPSITVCPEPHGYKEDVLKEHGIADLKTYHRGGTDRNMTWSSNHTDVSEKDLFLLSTYKPHEIFYQIYIRFFKANRNGKFAYDMPPTHMEAVLHEQRHRQFGRCYTVKPESWMARLGIYYMTLKMFIPVKIYFHQVHQFLDFSGRMGYKVFLGQEVQAQINFEDTRVMSRQKCIPVNYDACMYSTLEKHMMASHGCVVPYIMSDKPICKEDDKVNATYWIAWNRVTNQFDDCRQPCNVLMVSVGGKNVQPLNEKGVGKVNFYFSPRVALNTEKYFYNIVSLVAEIGGYVGLILGVSLFHMAGWAITAMDSMIAEMEQKEEELGPRKKLQSESSAHAFPRAFQSKEGGPGGDISRIPPPPHLLKRRRSSTGALKAIKMNNYCL